MDERLYRKITIEKISDIQANFWDGDLIVPEGHSIESNSLILSDTDTWDPDTKKFRSEVIPTNAVTKTVAKTSKVKKETISRSEKIGNILMKDGITYLLNNKTGIAKVVDIEESTISIPDTILDDTTDFLYKVSKGEQK